MHRLLFIAWNQQELLERNYFNKNDFNGAQRTLPRGKMVDATG
jgi:hypothetical protein